MSMLLSFSPHIPPYLPPLKQLRPDLSMGVHWRWLQLYFESGGCGGRRMTTTAYLHYRAVVTPVPRCHASKPGQVWRSSTPLRHGLPFFAFANASDFFTKSASISTMGAFTSGGAVFIEPELNGGSGSYSLMSWQHSA